MVCLSAGAIRILRVESCDDDFSSLVSIISPNEKHPLWQNNVIMAPKQMRVIEVTSDKAVLRGWGNDAMGATFTNYGLTTFLHPYHQVTVHQVAIAQDIWPF